MFEGVIASFLKSLGITQDDVKSAQSVLQMAYAELQTLQAERVAFKEGTQQIVAHFHGKMETIQRQNEEILRKLKEMMESENERNGQQYPRIAIVAGAGISGGSGGNAG